MALCEDMREVLEMEIAPLIEVDPAIHHGAPVIRGTRVPASVVVGSLAGGMSLEQGMAEYSLTRAQVEAALRWQRNSGPS